MLKYTLLVLIIGSSLLTKAQVSCEQLQDKNKAVSAQLSLYRYKATPSVADFQQFKTAYGSFRDFVVGAADVEKDYDIQLLMQVGMMQWCKHYIIALQDQKKYNEAWDEAQFIFDKILLKSNYRQMDRQGNFVICSVGDTVLEIHENDYRDICSDLVGFACITALQINKIQGATNMFTMAGFKGVLKENAALRRVATDILVQRLDKGLTDDTTYLAAYKFLESDNTGHSFFDITSDFNNLTEPKALQVVTNPVLAERTGISPLNNIDKLKNIWSRYANLYIDLSIDTGFKYSGKFEVLKIGVEHYLQMVNARKKNAPGTFPYLTCMYLTYDEIYRETGYDYSVARPIKDILNSGNKELLNDMAQVYEIYAKNCVGRYPSIEKAHHYYSAYLCYRALGDNKKADKAFGKIDKDMLANDKKGFAGYRKM